MYEPVRTVSEFESALLQILHCLLGRAPLSQALPLVLRYRRRPVGLSRDAAALVQDALAKGLVSLLVKQGGWKRARHLCGREVRDGRLWQRTPARQLGLEFSANSLDFLMWITSANLTDPKIQWRSSVAAPLTLGDRLLLFLALDAVRGSAAEPTLAGKSPFADHPLCRLAFPDTFADQNAALQADLDFAPWMTGTAASILESMQDRLAERWVELERAKASIVSPQRMTALAAQQQSVLDAFLDAAHGLERRDLARFLLKAASLLLRDGCEARSWVASLDTSRLPLARRLQVYQAALTLLSQVDRLKRWQAEAQCVGYVDPEYAASQLWKSDWQQYDGDRVCRVAERVRGELIPAAATHRT